MKKLPPNTVKVEVTCPACGDVLPLATSIRDVHERPETGDVTICFSCGVPSIFDFTLKGNARPPTADEAREIVDSFDIQFALSEWRTRSGRR